MTRFRALLLTTTLAAALLVAAMPTAQASIQCEYLGGGGGGLVGRTVDYVANLEYGACVETVDYFFDACAYLLGPTFCASIA